MKKVSALLSLLLVCAICVGFSAFLFGCGEDVEGGIIYEVISGSNECRVSGLQDKSLTELTIPSTHGGRAVTEIAGNAFRNCKKLASVKVPDSVKHIGKDAFSGTAIVPEVSDNGYSTIDGWVVSITDAVKTAEVVKLSKDIRGVAYNVYDGIAAKSVEFDGDISDWCNIKFSTGLSNPLAISKTLVIDGSAVTDLVIPETVKEVPFAAFYGSNISSIDFGSVTEIGDGAFSDCKSLTKVVIPQSVVTVGSTAFQGCEKLADVTIGEGVKEIGNGAFMKCAELKEIVLPAAVEVMGAYVFDGCDKLGSVTVKGKAKRGAKWAETWASDSATNDSRSGIVHWDEAAKVEDKA